MGPMDVLDHSSRAFTYGSKMGIDATRKWKEEGFTREWPDLIAMDDGDQAAGGRDVAAAGHPGADERDAPSPRAREGQTFAGESLARPLRELRQAAAHAVRAAVRAARRAGRLAPARR